MRALRVLNVSSLTPPADPALAATSVPPQPSHTARPLPQGRLAHAPGGLWAQLQVLVGAAVAAPALRVLALSFASADADAPEDAATPKAAPQLDWAPLGGPVPPSAAGSWSTFLAHVREARWAAAPC